MDKLVLLLPLTSTSIPLFIFVKFEVSNALFDLTTSFALKIDSSGDTEELVLASLDSDN